MTAYYRNRETDIVQAHPVSGLGETFNSIEVGEDGKPIDGSKPKAKRAPKVRAPLGTSRVEVARRQKLVDAPSQTTGGTPAAGDSNKQEETK